MEKLKKWLIGYAGLYVSGSRTERFLSLLKHKNIPIWDVQPMQDGYCFYIQRTYIRELSAIRKKTGTHIDVTKKIGLPYLLFRYRKRKVLVLAAFVCAILVYMGTRFIWNIQIDGTYYYTPEQIQSRIEQAYVTLGQRKSEIDCDLLEEQLRADFPEISWISCEIIGTQLHVEIKETLEGTETLSEDGKPQDIVAAKDGVIVEMITRSGTPLVKRGDSVSKGDTLISGVVYIYDDYDEVLETDYVASDGDVIAETSYLFADSFPMQYYEKDYSGNTHMAIGLTLMNWSQSFRLPGREFINQDEVSQTHQLCLGHTYYLPVSVTITKQQEYEPVLHEYSEEEARERMNNRIEKYLEQLQEKEVEIMENHVTIEIRDGTCSASGPIITWERIGYGQPIAETGNE